ncbi:hypothetical protein KR074_011350, partial [Drosophila pseudoananassae]
METQRTIVDFPLEILDLIFNQLRKHHEKLNLALAHPVLEHAFAYHSRHLYEEIRPWSYLSFESWSILLKHCGRNVKSLTTSMKWDPEVGKLIAEHCPRLETLCCYVKEKHDQSIQTFLFRIMDRLKSVEIHVPYKLHPSIVSSLMVAPNLRKFTYVFSDEGEVYNIKKLKRLEELTINTRKHLWNYSINITEICTPLKNLRTLHLFNVHFETEGIGPLAIWPSLEELHIKDCKISGLIPHCPKIKVFQISKCRSHRNGVIHSFLAWHFKTLGRLEVNLNNQAITAFQFLDFIKVAKNLTYFNWGLEHFEIERERFLRELLRTLQENGFSADKPFEIV